MAALRGAPLFLLLGLAMIGVAVLHGGWWWLFLWPALSCGWVALAYARLGPAILGKRPDGRLALWAMPPLLPYFLGYKLAWRLVRRFRREACCNEVVPGLWIGRRVLPSELPAGIGLVVDLTAEFAEPAGVRDGRDYLSFPILDDWDTDGERLVALVETIRTRHHATFIHCASGHGRSAMVAEAVLIARGDADTVEQAEAIVKKSRPAIGPNVLQQRLVAGLVPRLRQMSRGGR